MKFKSRLCLIVDAYCTGQYLPAELKKYGFDCIHVQSIKAVPEMDRRSFHQANFIENIVYDGDINKTLKQVSSYDISFVLIGAESGVELGDILSEKMGLLSNGISFSQARRNKFKMMEVLRRDGIRVVEDIKSAKLDVILSWANSRDKWPIVLKPLNSTCSNNVIFCENESDIVSAFQRIIKSKNLMGQQNSEVLAQEFIDGTEYYVNTVTVQGKHHITEMWQHRKQRVLGAGYIYDTVEPIPFDGLIQTQLRHYICDVLDSLRIRFGPAHSEVMIANQRPVLIETGARLAGAIFPSAVSKCFGSNQVELAVESYIAPEKFLEKVGKPYSLRKKLLYVSLISEYEGIIQSISKVDEIKKLPSFFDMHLSINVGSHLQKTIDFITSPGYIYLIHEELEVLWQDYYTIRNLEKKRVVRSKYKIVIKPKARPKTSRDVYFAKVDKNGTSQTCSNCGAHTGKKTLDVRIHHCDECNYKTTRDVAASQEIRNRGIKRCDPAAVSAARERAPRQAVGQIVSTARPAYGEPSSPSFLAKNVCGLKATGSIGYDAPVDTGRSRKLAS